MSENIVITETSETDSLPLQESYPYIFFQESGEIVDSTTTAPSNRTINFGFNEYFPLANDTQKILIKEAYPGKYGDINYKRAQTEIWFTPLMFLMFLCYGFVLLRKKKVLLQDIKEFFTFTHRNETLREETFIDNFQSRILLSVSGILNITLFSFYAIDWYLHYPTKNFTLVLSLILLLTLLYVLLKLSTIKLICYVFFNKNLSYFWTKTFYSFIIFFGITLIPVVLCLYFGPATIVMPVVNIGLILTICFSISYLSKITSFFFRGISSLFYLILYLCSLEILPAIIFGYCLTNIITNNG